MGKNKDNEQIQALDAFIEQGTIDEVLGVVKSGKEATVYRCRRGEGLVAAKVYRSVEVRRFSNDAVYRAGRLRQRQRRETRAIEAKTRAGREMAFGRWVADEYATLSLLHRAGADVPAPIAQSESIVLMEYIGDEDEPAPVLSSVRLPEAEATAVFARLLRNIELALACDRIHGDLSAFNVLYWHGEPRIIDFPQAVDPRFNPNALALLERDIENLAGYFARAGVRADPYRAAREMWGRFVRSEL